jgi:DNA-directed RNA polymerase specialized sigma24 family protein
MDRSLVERAMHGDEAAFDTLIERYGTHLLAVARRLLRDPFLAEDATPRTEARRERRHRDTLRLLPMDEPVVLDSASRIAIQQQLDHAFGKLGVEHRTVVVLIHYVGLTAAEVAEAMGTPVGTVRSRLHYALQHLRAAVEADIRLERTAGTA